MKLPQPQGLTDAVSFDSLQGSNKQENRISRVMVRCILLTLPLIVVVPVQASIIVSVSGSNDNGGLGILPRQTVAMSFMIGHSYTGVTINADLTGSFTGTAYLTNQIGAGTTIANQIASSPFTSAGLTTLFQNLSLDNAGTYYLVLATASITGPQGITDSIAPIVTTDAGAFNNGPGLVSGSNLSFAPADTFFPSAVFPHYTVSTAVPEPSTWLMFGSAIVVLLGYRTLRMVASSGSTPDASTSSLKRPVSMAQNEPPQPDWRHLEFQGQFRRAVGGSQTGEERLGNLAKRARLTKFLVVFAAVVLFGRSVSAANIVTNPGFETGDFTGWMTIAAMSGSDFAVAPNNGVPINPHSGNFYAEFGGAPNSYDAITQNLTTVPGLNYTISYWLRTNQATNQGSTDADLQVFWNGVLLADFHPISSSALAYQQFSFVRPATGATTLLRFQGFDGPGFILLDDVVVDGGAAVPEPATFSLLGAALLLAGLARKAAQKHGRLNAPRSMPSKYN